MFTQGYGRIGKYVCGLLDLATGTATVHFLKHTNTVMHGTLDPDGTLAATCDAQGEIWLWKTADGSAVQKLAGQGRTVWSAAWSNDGKHIAWGIPRTAPTPSVLASPWSGRST